MRARIDTVTDNLRRGTVHTLYTPTAEAEICLTCPLKECKKAECKRFKDEKKKLKGRKEETERKEKSMTIEEKREYIKRAGGEVKESV